MHYQAWLSIAFTTLVVARTNFIPGRSNALEARSLANLPTIKATLDVVNRDTKELDKAIADLTAANAATQISVINSKLKQLSNDVSAQAKKLNSSGSIGMLELTGLLSESTRNQWITLAQTLLSTTNQTYQDVQSKKEIIKASGKVDVLTEGIRAQKKSLLDIVSIIPSQIPPFIKNQISAMATRAVTAQASGTGAPRPFPKMPDLNDPKLVDGLGKAIDGFLDQVIAVLKGQQESITMPALPNGFVPKGAGIPKMSEAPGGSVGSGSSTAPTPAVVPAASAPKTVAPAPKATPAAKGPLVE